MDRLGREKSESRAIDAYKNRSLNSSMSHSYISGSTDLIGNIETGGVRALIWLTVKICRILPSVHVPPKD